MGQMRWTDDLTGVLEEPDRLQPKQFGPDAALEDRLRRRDTQRSMFAGRMAPTRAQAHSGPQTQDFGSLVSRGVPARTGDLERKAIRQGLPGATDDAAWTKLGTRFFVNRDEMSSMQSTVYEPRVAEIRDNPAMGQNPRFPANHETPHAIFMGNDQNPRGFEAVLANGNHRVAAELDKGALFTEVRGIPSNEAARSAYMGFQIQRAARRRRAEEKHGPGHPAKLKLPRIPG